MPDSTQRPTGVDLDRALLDPESVFATPEGVLARVDLSPGLKAAILRSWAYDANEMAVAEEEGMMGNETDLQRRVLLALVELTGGIRQTAPTKQHGAS